MSELTPSRRADWLVPAGLILLSAVPAVAGTATLASVAAGTDITARNARFIADPAPVVLHLLAAVPFSLLGAFQFAPRFRRERRGWHRAAGRVLAPLGLLAAFTGLWMAHLYPWPAGDGEALYALRLVFGSAMAVSILLSLDAIRRRDFGAHGQWMIRAYAIGLGAGTQVLTHLPYFVFVGAPDEISRAVLMGAGWVINVIVAEWVILRSRRTETHAVMA